MPALTSASPCTAVLQRHPELYLFGTLSALEGFLVADERIATWRTQFEGQLAAANRAGARR